MHVVIFCDMEGISCIEHWDQVTGGTALYEECRKLYTDEMNAAVRGARAAGASRSKWWIVMAQAAPIVLKALSLSAWKLARNIFSAIPGHAILHLLSRDVMPSYSWERTPWRVRPMAYSVTRSPPKPGTTHGSMIRWSVRAASWRPSPDVGMSLRYLSQATKRPGAR